MSAKNNLKKRPKTPPNRLYSAARYIAAAAGVFAVLLSVLMIVNYIQIKSVDPLNSPALVQLMDRLQENPQDEALKEQIRALDLLARKAYFTHQWQLRTGSYLLFVFVLIFVIAMKYRSSFHPSLPDLEADPPPDDSWENKFLARKYLLYGGLGLFVLAFVLGILSESQLNRTGAAGAGSSGGRYPSLEELRRNWPNFRGPEGIGIAYVTDVPMEWNGESEENILWKVALPLPGFNSPVIWGKKVFLSGADRRRQVVYCLDADSGRVLWEQPVENVPGSPEQKPRPSPDTGYAAPTLAVDGKRVHAIFATGDAACFDLEGKLLWAKNLGSPDNHYGHSSSLITYQDLLLVQFDQNTGGHLIALMTQTGDIVYDTPRETEISWASPIVVNTGERDEVILNSNPFVISYAPRTGRELWRVRCMLGEVAPSPAFTDGMVFAVNDYARLVGIRPGSPAEIVWEYIDDLSEVSSPLAAGGLVFMPSSYGTVTCFDAKTGKNLWLEEYDEGFYSSPILAGDRVFLMDMRGVMYIFKAAPEYELLGRNELGEDAVTIPAFMHNRIYIRGVKNLYCIGE